MRASMTCREAVDHVTDAMEGALDRATLNRFLDHLARCETCALFVRQIEETLGVLRTLPADVKPIDERVVETFRHRYHRSPRARRSAQE